MTDIYALGYGDCSSFGYGYGINFNFVNGDGCGDGAYER